MKSYLFFTFTALLLLALHSSFAQDVRLSYSVDQISPEIHKIEIAAQAASNDQIALKEVNFSLAFDLSCSHPTGYQTMFTDTWTTYLENAKVSPGLVLGHRSEQISARWQFGSADPGLPATSIVDIPLSSEEPLPIISITFEGKCSHDIYLESQSQNSLNQFADEQMKMLDYEVVHPVTHVPFEFVSVDAFPIDGERTQILW